MLFANNTKILDSYYLYVSVLLSMMKMSTVCINLNKGIPDFQPYTGEDILTNSIDIFQRTILMKLLYYDEVTVCLSLSCDVFYPFTCFNFLSNQIWIKLCLCSISERHDSMRSRLSQVILSNYYVVGSLEIFMVANFGFDILQVACNKHFLATR